ncbi:MAG: DNA-directed RNA polymerase subunit beta', partial [Clostridia bacterium]|nr:DNA-directed RNA polymerase subunit beta' [Clostridia bacterium]
DSGYLTRRLVDVAHDVIVKEDDCGDTRGFAVKAVRDSAGAIIETLKERIAGRFSVADIVDKNGEILVARDTLITEDDAARIEKAGIEEVKIRSVLTCKAKQGVCAKCYGANMSSWNKVKIGEAVGIIAAQSIGEPGTQLTMRTFHTGGIATNADITQGLPRVEELFEARTPKGKATVTTLKGVVSIKENDEKTMKIITVTGADNTLDYKIPNTAKLLVSEGDTVEAGDPLMVGSIYPQDTLRTKGVQGVQESMIREVQSAYRSNGVNIQDKHIEVIVRQMLRKVKITEPNDTNLLLGEVVDLNRMEEENERVLEEGGMPANGKRILLGITKASLATDSFLSAASFQETTRVLVDAAIRSKVDHFVGLKENVIIGKLIPAGTGMKCYRNITLEKTNAASDQPVVEEKPLLFDDYEEEYDLDANENN